MEIRSGEWVPSGPLFLLVPSTDLVKLATDGIIYFCLNNFFLNQLTNARLAVWDNASFKHL